MGVAMTKTEQERLECQVRDAHAAARNGDLSAAQALVDEVVRNLERAGLSSSYVTWLAAVVADGFDKHVEAMSLIEQACIRDPGSPSCRASRRIVYTRSREAFHAAVRRGDTGTALLLYEALARGGEADRAVRRTANALGPTPWLPGALA
jgi:hypothetical protein